MSATIPLRNLRGDVVAHAQVDAEDSWAADVGDWRLATNGYAVLRVGPHTLYLHRLLLELGVGDRREGDHKDRDKLNCRRSNLRVGTHALNTQNVGSVPGTSSRYRGVTWDASRGKWAASAKLNGRRRYLGRFVREEDAGAATAAFRAEHMPFSVEAMA